MRDQQYAADPKPSTVGQFRQAGKDFLPAFKSTWPYTLLGLFLGGALLIIDHYIFSLSPSPGSRRAVGSLVLEHLGLGFIVSAVAVFFYEWGAHHKKILDHSKRLAEIQDQLTRLRHEKGVAALDLSLAALLPDDGEEAVRLRLYIREIAQGLSQLIGSRIWAKSGYIECLSRFLEVTRDNVYSLANVETPGDHLYSVGGTLTADSILAVQMRELEAGDSYEVISHLESWIDRRLAKLHKESNLALGRGVAVKRLFNLVRDCSTLEPETVRKILTQHLLDAGEFDNYKAKVLLRRSISPATPVYLRQRIEGAQAASFVHKAGLLRVRVDRTDLTELLFSTRGELRADRELFEEMWSLGIDLNKSVIEECVNEVRFSRAVAPNQAPAADG